MNSIFEKAVAFALKAHEGQTRKGGGAYILHPLEDASIVSTMTDDPEVLAAAVLHDTVEDTDVTEKDILENFGERVAELVAHETENKRPELDPRETWKIRKEESLELLKNGDRETKMLWLGDKLSNMRALARDFEKQGEAAFNRFNVTDPLEHRWYYGTIVKYLEELKEYPAYKEFKLLFHYVFDHFQ